MVLLITLAVILFLVLCVCDHCVVVGFVVYVFVGFVLVGGICFIVKVCFVVGFIVCVACIIVRLAPLIFVYLLIKKIIWGCIVVVVTSVEIHVIIVVGV